MSTTIDAFSLNTGPIDEGTRALAEAELRETPERVAEACQRLRELLHADKTIYFRDDDEFLLIFLRPCKFYPESAHALMKRVAEFKKNNADLLENLMPDDEKDSFLKHNVVNIFKERDHKCRRVLLVNCGAIWDPKAVTADQMFRLFYLIHEMAILEPETQVRGVVVLMDFEGMTMKQAKSFTPSFAMRLLTFIQDAMPIRLKEVHFVKEPWVFSIVWQLFKPFIRQKLKSRMYFHKNNMDSLHKFLQPSHIPSNYGGKLPEIDYTGAQWYPCVIENLEHIKAWNSYGLVKE